MTKVTKRIFMEVDSLVFLVVPQILFNQKIYTLIYNVR